MSAITFNTSYKKKPQKKVILYNVPTPIRQVQVPLQVSSQVPAQVPVQVPEQVPVVKKSVVLSNSSISITDRIKEQYLKKNIIT